MGWKKKKNNFTNIWTCFIFKQVPDIQLNTQFSLYSCPAPATKSKLSQLPQNTRPSCILYLFTFSTDQLPFNTQKRRHPSPIQQSWFSSFTSVMRASVRACNPNDWQLFTYYQWSPTTQLKWSSLTQTKANTHSKGKKKKGKCLQIGGMEKKKVKGFFSGNKAAEKSNDEREMKVYFSGISRRVTLVSRRKKKKSRWMIDSSS